MVYEGFQILDVTGPAAVFEIAGHFGAPYSVELASLTGGTVASSGGIKVETTALAEAPLCDTMLVPGADDAWKTLWPAEMLEAVADAARSGRRVASVCSGAFLLAAAGVLDGRRAATHWAAAPVLKRRYPMIAVDPDSNFVEDRGVWMSAGVAAGIDLALGIIARNHGDAIERKVAQKMVVYHRRPGT